MIEMPSCSSAPSTKAVLPRNGHVIGGQESVPSQQPSNCPRDAKKSCFAPTSIKGAVFNLTAAVLGSGILLYPFAFRASGLLWGLFLLTICTYFAYISLNFFIISSNHMPHSEAPTTYSSLAFASGGKKCVILSQIVVN